MQKKHKYYDVIVAWANGEQIQYCTSHEPVWTDFESTPTPCVPAFNNNLKWRIKPKTYTKKYRMALLDSPEGSAVFAICLDEYSLDFPAERELTDFVRWVGEAVEVEFEE